MAKAKTVGDGKGGFYGIRISCPGCGDSEWAGAHVLPVRWCPPNQAESPDVATKPHWEFNGNFDMPTLSPSILSTSNRWTPPVTNANMAQWKEAPWEQKQVPHVCHSFVTDGRIQYLNDCTHSLAGQTIDLPELDTEFQEHE